MRVLAVGAHPDDVDLGCFATLAKHTQNGDEVHILIMTAGESAGDPEQRKGEVKESAKLINASVTIANQRDTMVHDDWESISVIEQHVRKINPYIVYTHSDKDRHQDHRNTARATISAARFVPEVYMFETPSTLQHFAPQRFVDVTDTFAIKLEALHKHQTQSSKMYMMEKAMRGLAEFRAYQAHFVDVYVEAFEVIRIVESDKSKG